MHASVYIIIYAGCHLSSVSYCVQPVTTELWLNRQSSRFYLYVCQHVNVDWNHNNVMFLHINEACIFLNFLNVFTHFSKLIFTYDHLTLVTILIYNTRRPASADRTARRQFQATDQPVSRTQASDAMKSRLPRYEGKCVQRRCFQCESVPLRSDIKGTELPFANILIPL